MKFSKTAKRVELLAKPTAKRVELLAKPTAKRVELLAKPTSKQVELLAKPSAKQAYQRFFHLQSHTSRTIIGFQSNLSLWSGLMPGLAAVMFCLATAFLSPSALAQDPAPSPDYLSNPKYVSAMAEGKKLTARRQPNFALDEFKKANKVAAGQDIRALTEIFNLQLTMGNYKEALAAATQRESISLTLADKVSAETDRGRALYSQAGEKGKPELLQAADAAFKAAIANSPRNGMAHYFDGKILARLGQMDAASQEFKECLSCITPKDASYVRVQHFAENPALANAKMAPAFQVVALDGSKFNLDEMGGRVVLIDFWATWCGPCKEELPHIKKIAKEFAGQPLVIISVSWDADETKWKNFIDKNEMTWVQYRDADHQLSKNFAVDAIPHYFTIDTDGVLTAEMLGSGSDVEGKLKKLIAKARARVSQTASNAATGN
jgi:thiol-disulfide isomerase/thioredoxin